MNLKTKIKNDLWQINYIIPFTVKYLQGGKLNYMKRSIPIIGKLKVIKGKGERDIASDTLTLMQRVELKVPNDNRFFYWLDEHKTIVVRGNILSNFTLDYDRIIHGSFHELAGAAMKVNGKYGQRAAQIKDAVYALRDRCLEAIRNDKVNQHSNEMVDDFVEMLERPAKHLREGLQRILFFNQFLWQTRHGLNGLGRLDKILHDLYDADVRDGIISKDQVFEMLCEFLRCLHKWYEYKSSALLGDTGQIIILGGIDRDGSHFCNDLTYLWLEAQAAVKQPDPKILLRVSKAMPDDLLETAVKCLDSKTGSPLFSNDDVVIPQLLQFGMTMNDATAYCVSACWEPFIPGKSLDQNNIRTFDFFKPLDICMNSIDLSGIKIFDDLLAAFEEALRKEWVSFLNGLDELIWARDPFVTMFTDGCNESGKDICEGGAVYNNYGVTSVGMGSVCDSLLNIKKLVFDDKQFTLKKLNEARKSNYKANPEILAQLKNMQHYFAHHDKAAVQLVNHIIKVSNKEVEKYTNPIKGKVKFGLSSPNYIKSGSNSMADFAGRINGTPYGTHISSTDASYTEIVKFAGKLDYSGYCFNGNVVDFFVSPGLLKDHVGQFVQYLKSAIRLGFFQMQMNIMDSATLIDAKANPEKYPGLIVRVWGFSAYFSDLPEKYKDVLIERALKNEAVGN